jgi:hypothetical protein
MIVRVLSNSGNPKVEDDVRQEVTDLTSRYPVPGLDL